MAPAGPPPQESVAPGPSGLQQPVRAEDRLRFRRELAQRSGEVRPTETSHPNRDELLLNMQSQLSMLIAQFAPQKPALT